MKLLGKYAQCSSEPINHIYPNTQPCFSPFVCSFWVSAWQKKKTLVRLCRHHFTLFHRGFDFMLHPRAPTFTHTHTHSVSCRHSWLSGTIGVNLARTAVTSGAHTHTHTHTSTQRDKDAHICSVTHILYSLPCDLHYLSLCPVCWWQQRLTAVTKVNLASLNLDRFNALNATTPPSRNTSGRVAPASGPSNPTPSRL